MWSESADLTPRYFTSTASPLSIHILGFSRWAKEDDELTKTISFTYRQFLKSDMLLTSPQSLSDLI